ncbi:MAG: hypothetical protein R3A48_01955 [Polyangiales bacterium]
MIEQAIRVRFEPPEGVTVDARLEVRLDGRALYVGRFLSGFDAHSSVAPGEHVLTTAIHVGALTRARRYAFSAGGGALRDAATRSRSRSATAAWGNFSRGLSLRAL